MAQTFLHKIKDDKRSSNELALTEKLTEKLTQLNLKRIQNRKQQQKNILNQKTDLLSSISKANKKILFICLCGVPPFQNEFDELNLPGQIIKFICPGFQNNLSEIQLQKRALKSDLNELAKQIDAKINTYPSDNSLVFVYHSFGTFVFSFYLKHFVQKQKHRIKSIIQLGGAPIRVYPIIQAGFEATENMGRQMIEQNADFIFQQYAKQQEKLKAKGITIVSYKNKYNLQGLFLTHHTKGFNQIFQMNRNLPEVIKLFIYGSKDAVFLTKNIDQKTVFFTYNKQKALKQEYLSPLRQKYQKLYGQNVGNLQQKFIYKIPNAKHSLHMQKQYIPLLQDIINDYLSLII